MDNKEKIIGEFKPKRKFLNFVSAVDKIRVRVLQKPLLLKEKDYQVYLMDFAF